MLTGAATMAGAIAIRYFSTKRLTNGGGSGYRRISRPQAPFYATDRFRFGRLGRFRMHGRREPVDMRVGILRTGLRTLLAVRVHQFDHERPKG